MQIFAKTLPEYSVVRDMPCIGDTLAPQIIAEIGDVRRFTSKHALIAYAGIDAPPYQSGAFSASNGTFLNGVTAIFAKLVMRLCRALSSTSRSRILFMPSFRRSAARINLAKKQ